MNDPGRSVINESRGPSHAAGYKLLFAVGMMGLATVLLWRSYGPGEDPTLSPEHLARLEGQSYTLQCSRCQAVFRAAAADFLRQAAERGGSGEEGVTCSACGQRTAWRVREMHVRPQTEVEGMGEFSYLPPKVRDGPSERGPAIQP